MTQKKCPVCGLTKDIEYFCKSSKDKEGVGWECQECARLYRVTNKHRFMSIPIEELREIVGYNPELGIIYNKCDMLPLPTVCIDRVIC